ncbi:hypothetical protein, partial [Streptomyces lasiicapitis]|uniref:hypothetical protein n=1 Tax=Streptomyces lasiicapitis TaxID=1923961 RepID=UPI00364B15E8
MGRRHHSVRRPLRLPLRLRVALPGVAAALTALALGGTLTVPVNPGAGKEQAPPQQTPPPT